MQLTEEDMQHLLENGGVRDIMRDFTVCLAAQDGRNIESHYANDPLSIRVAALRERARAGGLDFIINQAVASANMPDPLLSFSHIALSALEATVDRALLADAAGLPLEDVNAVTGSLFRFDSEDEAAWWEDLLNRRKINSLG